MLAMHDARRPPVRRRRPGPRPDRPGQADAERRGARQCMSARTQWLRARDRRLTRDRRRDRARRSPPTAGRSASTTAQTRRPPTRSCAAIETGWRPRGRVAGRRRPTRRRPTGCSSCSSRRYGCPVLVLVNNAGVSADDLTPSMSDEAWSTVIDTDLTAAFRFTRRALKPMMRARVGPDRQRRLGRRPARQPRPGQLRRRQGGADRVHAQRRRRGGAARDHDQRGRARLDRNRHDRRRLQDLLAQVPARRAGTPEEVAACVRFLTSDQAGYVTGAVLSVDGGLAA